MKKIQAATLLLALLLCVYALTACVGTPSDVTVDPDSWKPNDRNEPSTPGADSGDDGSIEEPNGNGVGIGENAPVDLPFLPVS